MQDAPLSIARLVAHGTALHGASTVQTWTGDGFRSATYAEVGSRAARLAHALDELGATGDARVGTFMWNDRHDRQPEGRRLQPPLDRAALDGRLHGRRHGPQPGRQGAGHRAAVPRHGLGPAVLGDDGRRLAGDARSLPAAGAAAGDDPA